MLQYVVDYCQFVGFKSVLYVQNGYVLFVDDFIVEYDVVVGVWQDFIKVVE